MINEQQIFQLMQTHLVEEWAEEDGHGWVEFAGTPAKLMDFAREIYAMGVAEGENSTKVTIPDLKVRTVQITDIEFDCTRENPEADDIEEWSDQMQLEYEETLKDEYTGQIVELWVVNPKDDDEVGQTLVDEISDVTGWCVLSVTWRHVLKGD